MKYENSDGSPFTIHTDYFGRVRNADNPLPGSFELPPGKVLLKVWPKK